MSFKTPAVASIAAILIAFGAQPIHAQGIGPDATQGEPASPASASAEMVGKGVFDSSGQQIGVVDEITTVEDGSEAAILSVGEFLGIGEKKIAVLTSELQANSDGSGYTLAMSAEDIEAAPTYGDAAEEPEEPNK
jgi:sporulation protein YlmC with PRC-barrel domain